MTLLRMVLVALLSLAVDARGQQLRVAMSGSYPPLHAPAAGGGFEGFEAELAKRLAAVLGRELVFVDASALSTTTLQAVTSGRADIALNAITITPERRASVDFTRPYLTLRYLLAGGREKVDLATLRDRVAVTSDLTAAAVAQALPVARVVRYPSLGRAVDAYARAEIDWIAGEDVALLQAIAGTKLCVAETAFGQSEIGIAAPLGGAGPYDEALATLAPEIGELRQRFRPGKPPEHRHLLPEGATLGDVAALRRYPRALEKLEDGPEGFGKYRACGRPYTTLVISADELVTVNTQSQGSDALIAVKAVDSGVILRVHSPVPDRPWDFLLEGPVEHRGYTVYRWSINGHPPSYVVPVDDTAVPVRQDLCGDDH